MKFFYLTSLPQLLALTLAMGVATPLQAGSSSTSDSLTLESALRRSMAAHPALRAAYERHQAALQRVPQAKSLPDPKLSFTHFITAVETRTGPQENQLMLSQAIPWFGKLRLHGEAASGEAAAALHVYEAERLRLVATVSQLFYDYAFLARENQITSEIIELLEGLEPVVREKVRVGGARAEVLRLELELGKIRDSLARLAGRRSALSASLSAAMGETPTETPLPWPHDLDSALPSTPDFNGLASEMGARHPSLLALDDRRSAAEDRIELARRRSIPDPIIGANVIDIGDGGDTAVGVTLGFSVPIWWGKYRAERSEAEAEQRALIADHQAQTDQLQAELRAAVATFQTAAATAKRFAKELLPAAEETIEVSEIGYTTGELTLTDLIDAERVALEIRLTHWRAVADAQAAWVRAMTLAGRDQSPEK